MSLTNFTTFATPYQGVNFSPDLFSASTSKSRLVKHNNGTLEVLPIPFGTIIGQSFVKPLLDLASRCVRHLTFGFSHLNSILAFPTASAEFVSAQKSSNELETSSVPRELLLSHIINLDPDFMSRLDVMFWIDKVIQKERSVDSTIQSHLIDNEPFRDVFMDYCNVFEEFKQELDGILKTFSSASDSPEILGTRSKISVRFPSLEGTDGKVFLDRGDIQTDGKPFERNLTIHDSSKKCGNYFIFLKKPSLLQEKDELLDALSALFSNQKSRALEKVKNFFSKDKLNKLDDVIHRWEKELVSESKTQLHDRVEAIKASVDPLKKGLEGTLNDIFAQISNHVILSKEQNRCFYASISFDHKTKEHMIQISNSRLQDATNFIHEMPVNFARLSGRTVGALIREFINELFSTTPEQLLAYASLIGVSLAFFTINQYLATLRPLNLTNPAIEADREVEHGSDREVESDSDGDEEPVSDGEEEAEGNGLRRLRDLPPRRQITY